MDNARLKKHILIVAQSMDSSKFEHIKESIDSIKKALIKSLVIGGSQVDT